MKDSLNSKLWGKLRLLGDVFENMIYPDPALVVYESTSHVPSGLLVDVDSDIPDWTKFIEQLFENLVRKGTSDAFDVQTRVLLQLEQRLDGLLFLLVTLDTQLTLPLELL